MLRNDQQLAVARRQRDEARSFAANGDSQENAVYTEYADELDLEIRDYEAIKAGYSKSFEITESDDIGECLVKARIAHHWTQARLADALGIAEQQIQRYEADGYQRTSLWRVSEIIDALGYKLHGCVEPTEEEAGGVILEPRTTFHQFQPMPESGSNSAQPKDLEVVS
jgi:ribosome-binding protein aMBF1 (putative translation factor)